MNPGTPRFRGGIVNSGNRQRSRTDSESPENLPSLCLRYLEGRKSLLKSAFAATGMSVAMPADSEGYLRFLELITKKRLEIKSFLLFFAGFSVHPRPAPPQPLFPCHFSGEGKRACVAAGPPPGIAHPLSEAGSPCGRHPRFHDLFLR